MKHHLSIKIVGVWLVISVIALLYSCQNSQYAETHTDRLGSLRSEISSLLDSVDGNVGVAVITSSGDTMTINNNFHYPLMSVFKLHQSLAVAHLLDSRGAGLDTVLHIENRSLDRHTWSPMLRDHGDVDFVITIDSLLVYILQQSDNNASNLLFDRIASVGYTDSIVRHLTGIRDFSLSRTERQMAGDHELSRRNWSTPLACAELIGDVVNGRPVSPDKQQRIKTILAECQTGTDRLKAAFADGCDITLYHKTGSGYRDSHGRLMAHNDIGYVENGNGQSYAIAVLVTDFKGSEQEASAIIALISRIVFDRLTIDGAETACAHD